MIEYKTFKKDNTIYWNTMKLPFYSIENPMDSFDYTVWFVDVCNMEFVNKGIFESIKDAKEFVKKESKSNNGNILYNNKRGH